MRTFRVFVVSLIVLFAVGSITISGNNAIGEEKEIEKVTLKVEGIKISCCAEKVQSALQKVPEVKTVEVSLERKEAVVEFEKGKVTLAQLIEAVKEAGYQASLASEKTVLKVEGMSTACCATEVEEALLKVEGVKKVLTCCHKRGIAVVEIDSGQVTTEQLIKAVEKAGFKASVEGLEEVTLKIEGMATESCAMRVEEALLKVEGVKKVLTCCHKRGIAVVEIDSDQVTTEQLIKAVEKAGFKASVEEMEKRGAPAQIESKFVELSMMYKIVKEELVEHWNSVEVEAGKIYAACCKWSLSRGMKIEDAEDYCKSAMLSGIGEQSLAEQRFKPIESKYREFSKRYNIPKKDLEEHWDFVKGETKKSYEISHKWSLSRNMKNEDAENYCKSAILSGMGEQSLAEKIFRAKVRKLTDDEIKDLSKDRYGRFADKYAETGNPCPIRNKQVKGLYNQEELSLVSKTALNLALGCGNPVSFANLKPGEVVMDLGCGAGIDVILAASKVGHTGRAIGVDFAPQMIEKAKQAVAEAGLQDRKVELYIGDIEKLQLPNSFADVVISNCVIVLVPNKDVAYKEAFRILKPGGRIAISDIVFSEKIHPKMKARFESIWSGVVGGAIDEKEYLEIVKRAGFRKIRIVKRYFLTPEELTAMSSCPGTEFAPEPDEKDVEAVQGKVVSIKFTAIKL